MYKNCLRTLNGRLRTICGHLWRDFSQGLMDFTIFAKCSIHVRTPTLVNRQKVRLVHLKSREIGENSIFFILMSE